jgi:hypothetical protein
MATRKQNRSSFRPELERLEDRCVPAVGWTTWTGNAHDGGLWNTAGNWDNGVPTAAGPNAYAARLVGSDNISVTTDTVVCGIAQYGGASNYTGELSVANGKNLEVLGSTNDATHYGLKWGSGNGTIGLGENSNLLIGGGDDTNNILSGGSLIGGSTATFYISNDSVVQVGPVTNHGGGSFFCSVLTDIGLDLSNTQQDNCSLRFHNQTSSATWNADIIVNASADSGQDNRLVMDTILVAGDAQIFFSNTSGKSHEIDNYDEVRWDGNNALGLRAEIDMPLKNAGGVFYVNHDFRINQNFGGSGTLYCINQSSGATNLNNGSELSLMVGGYKQTGGDLRTSDAAQDILDVGSYTCDISGGNIKICVGSPSSYGNLKIVGTTNWTGGIFNCTIDGADTNNRDVLTISGAANITTGASVTLTVNGTQGSGDWDIIDCTSNSGGYPTDNTANFTWSGTITNIKVNHA